MEKMARKITVRMPDDLYQLLEDVAEERGFSIADAARELLRIGAINHIQALTFDNREAWRHRSFAPESPEERIKEIHKQTARLEIIATATVLNMEFTPETTKEQVNELYKKLDLLENMAAAIKKNMRFVI
jgi:predicted DNA-binding protein